MEIKLGSLSLGLPSKEFRVSENVPSKGRAGQGLPGPNEPIKPALL